MLDDHSVELVDLRLFVHDVRAVRAKGGEAALELVPDGTFTTANVALLDFENGTGACNNGTPPTRTTLRVRGMPGDATGLRFRLGVPFAENHANPDLAGAPLDLTAMQWSWAAGHTFLRLDLRIDGAVIPLHIGSAGCTGTIGAINSCAFPGRADLAVAYLPTAAHPIRLDLAPFVHAALARPHSDGCMGNPDDVDCAPIFRLLGLDSTGIARKPAENVFLP